MASRFTILFDIFWLSLLLGVIYLLFLGHPPLFLPDDARYAEIGREMLSSKDFITPHLNHILYFEKPPLVYWLTALSLKLLGINEWGVRLPQCLFALIGCHITYVAGRYFFNRQTGIIAALILASSPLYFVMAHVLTLDLAVCVLLCTSLFLFLIGTQMQGAIKRCVIIHAAFVFAALAVLTKGLIGIVFPIMIIGLWTLLFNLWRQIKTWHLPTGIVLFMLIALPWHVLVQLKHPAFFHFYFIYQQFTRFSTQALHRYHHFYFFIPVIVFGFLPWSFYGIQSFFSCWKKETNKKVVGFLLIWIVTIFVFFSISHSKLVPYILPVFPPLSILVGFYFSEKLNAEKVGRGLIFPSYLLALIGIIMAIGILIAPLFIDTIGNKFIVYGFAVTIAGVALITFFSFHLLLKKQQLKIALMIVIVGTITLSLVGINLVPYLQNKSIKPLALKINQIKKPTDELVAYAHYFQDMPFYVGQPVTIVNWKNELRFGYEHQPDAKQRMIDTPEFIQRLKSNKRLLVIANQDDFQDFKKRYPDLKIKVIKETVGNVLFSTVRSKLSVKNTNMS